MDAKKDLKLNERLACTILAKLKYNSDGEFYKCRWNDACLWIAKIFLKGQDPIEFICWLLDFEEDEEKRLKNGLREQSA